MTYILSLSPNFFIIYVHNSLTIFLKRFKIFTKMHCSIMYMQVNYYVTITYITRTISLYGKLLVGKCPVGRPKMHFKDSLKMSLKDLEIPVKTWGKTCFQLGQMVRSDLKRNHGCWKLSCSWGHMQMSQKKIQSHKQHADTPSQLITYVVIFISQWTNNNNLYDKLGSHICIFLLMFQCAKAAHVQWIYISQRQTRVG